MMNDDKDDTSCATCGEDAEMCCCEMQDLGSKDDDMADHLKPGLDKTNVEDGLAEGTQFDRFMDATLLREHKQVKLDAKVMSPQRQIAAKAKEHPLGRIRMSPLPGGKR